MNITALRLRTLREKKGLSQREVARQIGVTRAALSKNHNDSIDNLRLPVVYWQNNFEIFYNAKRPLFRRSLLRCRYKEVVLTLPQTKAQPHEGRSRFLSEPKLCISRLCIGACFWRFGGANGCWKSFVLISLCSKNIYICHTMCYYYR
jgi:transcriptional regulator with XRE-family HTH domain